MWQYIYHFWYPGDHSTPVLWQLGDRLEDPFSVLTVGERLYELLYLLSGEVFAHVGSEDENGGLA